MVHVASDGRGVFLRSFWWLRHRHMVPPVEKRSNWNNRTRPPSGPLAVSAGGPFFGNSRCGNCHHKHLRRFPLYPTAHQCRDALSVRHRGHPLGCHGVVTLCAIRSHASIDCRNDVDFGLAQGAAPPGLATHSGHFASPKAQSELLAAQARFQHSPACALSYPRRKAALTMHCGLHCKYSLWH